MEQPLPTNTTIQNVANQTRRSIARPTWHGNKLRIGLAPVNSLSYLNHVPFSGLLA